jgi:hypothetical protein
MPTVKGLFPHACICHIGRAQMLQCIGPLAPACLQSGTPAGGTGVKPTLIIAWCAAALYLLVGALTGNHVSPNRAHLGLQYEIGRQSGLFVIHEVAAGGPSAEPTLPPAAVKSREARSTPWVVRAHLIDSLAPTTSPSWPLN